MKLEDIISEKKQVKMVTYSGILFYEIFKISKYIKKESKLVVAMACVGGIGNREWPLTGMGFLWGDDEHFLELNSGNGCIIL